MKATRKLVAIVLAALMVLALAVPAFADAATTKITVDDESTTTYAGYQLLSSTDDGASSIVYTVNSKYSSILQTLTGATDDAGVITALAAMTDAEITAFADDAYAAITDASLAADATFAGGTETTVNQGYWLIVETTDADGQEDTVVSCAILNTAGSSEITVTPKKALPTVEKTADVTTGDVGSEVEFTVTGTTLNYTDSYVEYIYTFHDSMTGLEYVEDSAAVSIDGTDKTTLFTVSFDEATGALTVTSSDLKGLITADSEIVLTYTAKITAAAITSSAENEVNIEYTNDPYKGGTGGSTGNTPPDDVKVYVANIVIDKFEDGTSTKKLPGAKFTLKNSDNKYYSWNATDSVVEWSDSEVIFETETDGSINFNGLGVGTYTLTEVAPPAGYNGLAAPLSLNISASENEGVVTFTDSEGHATFTGNTGTVQVANASGSELPTTGGTGTTLLIVFGVLAMLGAGVFLITNKRISKEEL